MATFFKTSGDFRKWLEKNHLKESELIVGYYKKDSGKASIDWPESVQQALCFGWIDGIRRSIDDISYCIRFTPRRPNSNWSSVNLNYMETLISQNLVHDQGLKVFNERNHDTSEVYGYEKNNKELSATYIKEFKLNKKAYQWFMNAPAHYRKTAQHWVMSAKQTDTQKKRLKELINDSENELRIKSLRPIKKAKS